MHARQRREPCRARQTPRRAGRARHLPPRLRLRKQLASPNPCAGARRPRAPKQSKRPSSTASAARRLRCGPKGAVRRVDGEVPSAACRRERRRHDRSEAFPAAKTGLSKPNPLHESARSRACVDLRHAPLGLDRSLRGGPARGKRRKKAAGGHSRCRHAVRGPPTSRQASARQLATWSFFCPARPRPCPSGPSPRDGAHAGSCDSQQADSRWW